jgi:RNA polymerase sigma factor (TIGR02999 family)
MRRILLNHARMRRAGKRGADPVRVELEHAGLVLAEQAVDDLIGLDEALERLTEFNPRGAEVVVYRYFGGLSHEEIAEVMDTSVVTVRRAWAAARTWLHRELREAGTR